MSKCKICGFEAGMINLKNGICKTCLNSNIDRENTLLPIHNRSLKSKLRSLFSTEFTFRLFVILQAIGFAGLVIMDLSNSYGWSIVPDLYDYNGKLRFDWDLFNSFYWKTRSHQYNWFALFFILAPIVIVKPIEWLLEAKHK